MLRCLSTLRQALKPVQESVLATSHPWPPRRIKPVCTRIHDRDHRREEGSHATGPPSSDLDTCALHLLLRTYRASAIPQQSCKVPLAPPKRHTLSSLPHCQPLLDTAMQSQIIRGKAELDIQSETRLLENSRRWDVTASQRPDDSVGFFICSFIVLSLSRYAWWAGHDLRDKNLMMRWPGRHNHETGNSSWAEREPVPPQPNLIG
ncbi:hypothetical protein CABS01_06934 [Colletotrichum abscissum]|uniref:uncharacterized protein n=1 Tax=Colletotrichum abscissum TaxID=1671311 RepID=UPI0027D6B83F|nr:uncharacterized protein CABS01_06934 [Colletotrichum abscissum]KAK1514955.1 hypothetical protein CABS01_06934 [Colletotrichum abscissum]